MAVLTEEEREIDAYAVLGIELAASEKDVQRAYRKKALKCHPDKHPGPEAAAMFHSISLALAILTDPTKRKYVDTRLEASRAQAARRADMDAKRKAGVDDLVRREEEAKRARSEGMARRKAAAQEEVVRSEGQRLVDEARARAAAAMNPAPPPPPPSKPPIPAIGPLDLTLSLQLPPSSALASDNTLSAALRKYGAISEIAMLPSKAKEGKKARGPRAVVEFAPGNWGGCYACFRDNSGGSAIEKGAKAKWVNAEPAWFSWAEKYGSERSTTAAPSFNPTPRPESTSFASTAPMFGNVSAAMAAHEQKTHEREEASKLNSSYESATLLRMRQKERERMAEQIRRQEEEEAA